MGVAHGSPGFEKQQTQTPVAAFAFHEVVVQMLWARLHLPEHWWGRHANAQETG